jgi:hypothetical protein
MSEANVKAQAILIVIKTILKWIGLSVIGIGILIFVGVQYDEYQTRKKKAFEDKVVIRALHPQEGPCSKDFPYYYYIINDSGKTIEKVTFTVAIKRIGFSSNINRYTSLDEDKIIPKNESYGRCFRAEDANDYRKNLTEKDVDIEITYRNIKFKE